MFYRSELFEEPHHQALEVLCAKALKRDDLTAAYRLADRRCRIKPAADAHCFLLRAEALYRMGKQAAAIEDLLKAAYISPGDIATNRRLLAWGKPSQRVVAAMALIEREQDVRFLRQAIAALSENGTAAVASLQVCDDAIEGWAAWRGAGPIRVSIADAAGRAESFFEAEPEHPLGSEMGSAAAFRLPRQRAPQFISVLRDQEIVAAIHTADEALQPPAEISENGAGDGAVTVIVPVYVDYQATKTCLESLLPQLDGSRHRAIVVDDASPDSDVRRLLREVSREANVQVLVNAYNLGFVGAVNRALREVSHGDVVLLNSDTVIPAGAIEHLASAARSGPDIGTVTPLSNNGEFTSFPVANRPNAMEAFDVAEVNRIAARVNDGRIVDIPNGIGFCLYITRACLNAVGFLSQSYHRGYLEDVDYCLRARLHGLRNVCATSVYVGHAGSRSFGTDKRALVVRNLKVLEQRFPAYRTECADFMLVDPLRTARQAIEMSLTAKRRGDVLLVSTAGAVAEVARERARGLACEGVKGVLSLEVEYVRGQIVARLRGLNEAVPQCIDLILPSEMDELIRMLQQIELSRIELFDLAGLPRTLSEALLGLQVSHDLFLAHTALGLGRGPFHKQRGSDQDLSFWRKVLASAGRVIVADDQAEALAPALLHPNVSRVRKQTAGAGRVVVRSSGPVARFGLVAVRGCAREQELMREVTIRMSSALPGADITVIGAMPDEAALMRAGAFVVGTASATELPELFECHRLDRVVVCMTQALFGHPIVEATMAAPIPVAFFDWSGGRCPPRRGDLALVPSPSWEEIARSLVAWLGRPVLV